MTSLAIAKAAKVGLATVARIEQGERMVQGNFATITKIQRALERKGITFTANQDHRIGVSPSEASCCRKPNLGDKISRGCRLLS